jgi:hypothetical protein
MAEERASTWIKYAAVLTYDGLGRFALAVAVKDYTNTVRASDSGASNLANPGELNEYYNTLVAAGFATQRTQYPSNLLTHAQQDALTLAGTL